MAITLAGRAQAVLSWDNFVHNIYLYLVEAPTSNLLCQQKQPLLIHNMGS